MGGLPKFLLPISDVEDTLLRRHIDQLRECTEHIVIATRPENAPLLRSYQAPDTDIVVAETSTMSETVMRVAALTRADSFLLGMPDTYFHESDPYPAVAAAMTTAHHGRFPEVALGVWRIRPEQRGQLGQVELQPGGQVTGAVDKDPACEYPHSWGVMAFRAPALSHLRASDPHIGYVLPGVLSSGDLVTGIEMSGEYIDCGTPGQFQHLMSLRIASRESP
jgi:hypothetical protein